MKKKSVRYNTYIKLAGIYIDSVKTIKTEYLFKFIPISTSILSAMLLYSVAYLRGGGPGVLDPPRTYPKNKIKCLHICRIGYVKNSQGS
jgi:hypothetical protein